MNPLQALLTIFGLTLLFAVVNGVPEEGFMRTDTSGAAHKQAAIFSRESLPSQFHKPSFQSIELQFTDPHAENSVPITSFGGPWDLTSSADVQLGAGQVWKAIRSPKATLSIAFREFAFETQPMGTFYRVVFGSGEDMIFHPVETSETGRFHRFLISGHSLRIFNVKPNKMDIRGSEMYFRVEEVGTMRSRVSVGFSAVIFPEAVPRQEILLFLEGWLEDLWKSSETTPGVQETLNQLVRFGVKVAKVEHFQYAFGPAVCTARREPTGICNSRNPLFGSAHTALRRIPPKDPAYRDGIEAPSGEASISPRQISNIVCQQDPWTQDEHNKLRLVDAFVFFGQFIDHDIALSPIGAIATDEQPLFSVSKGLFHDELPIEVPKDDPVFTGVNAKDTLQFERAVGARVNDDFVHPRQVLNSLTSFLDLGQVYGSDHLREKVLRTFKKGLLRTGKNEFLPFNGNVQDGVGIALENAPDARPRYYVAGDIRVQENPALAALHAIWLREHNKVAQELDAAFGFSLDDETLFQAAKSVCIALYQSIVYSEWLPLLLGRETVDPAHYKYNAKVDPSADAFFTTAAFRFGHSMVGKELWKVAEGQSSPFSVLPLRLSFFNETVISPESIDDITRGMLWHSAMNMDEQVVDDLRSFLFGTDGSPGMDLVALNIQRGRDLGLPSYNQAREMFHLPLVDGFSNITSDNRKREKLREAYKEVRAVDSFIGGLSEDVPEGRLLGDLFHRSVVDQFTRFRDGDRLFYKGYPFPDELYRLYPRLQRIVNDEVKLADVVIRNTGVTYLDLKGRTTLFQL